MSGRPYLIVKKWDIDETNKEINIQYVKASDKTLNMSNVNNTLQANAILQDPAHKKYTVRIKKGRLNAGAFTPEGAEKDLKKESIDLIRVLSSKGTPQRLEFFGEIGDKPTKKQMEKMDKVRGHLINLSEVLKGEDRREAEKLLEFGPGARERERELEAERAITEEQQAILEGVAGAEEEKEGVEPIEEGKGAEDVPAGAEAGRMEGEAGVERPKRREIQPEPGRMEGEAGVEEKARRRQEQLRAVEFEELEGAPPPPPVPGTEPGRMEGERGVELRRPRRQPIDRGRIEAERGAEPPEGMTEMEEMALMAEMRGEAGVEERARRRQEQLRAVRFEELEGAPPPPPVPGTEPGRMEGEREAEPRNLGALGGELSGGARGGEGFPAVMRERPPSNGGSIMSEEDAKKALKENPEAPGVNIPLIGPDSAKEQKEKGIIYKEQFNIVFSDRSGVRELSKFEQSEEGKEGMRKTVDNLFIEAEDIRKTYEDQLRLPRLIYSQSDDKKDLIKQWNELNVLKGGVIQNLTSGKSSDPLKNYNSIGVVVDISSLGMSLQDFLNYVQQKGLTPQAQNQTNNGNYRMTGFKKPLNLDDIKPEEDEEEEKEGEGPQLGEKSTEDPAQKMEVLGRAEVITNERIKGRVVSGLFKKPKQETKTQRIRVSL